MNYYDFTCLLYEFLRDVKYIPSETILKPLLEVIFQMKNPIKIGIDNTNRTNRMSMQPMLNNNIRINIKMPLVFLISLNALLRYSI